MSVYWCKRKFHGLSNVDLCFCIHYYTSDVFKGYLAQNHLLTAFSLLGLVQVRSYQLHIASMHGYNPYFAAFIALKPSEHTYFIAVIYRSCGGDLRY